MARLRTVETNLLHEAQHLHNTIQTLESLLRDQGMHKDLPISTIPASEERQSEQAAPLSTDFTSAEKPQLLVLQVPPVEEPLSFWPEFRQETCLVGRQNNLAASPDCNVQITSDHRALEIPGASGYQRHQLGSLDTATMGMEFVLA